MNDRDQVEAILGRLRDWLDAVQSEAGGLDRLVLSREDEPQTEVGIVHLVEEFTALRHELKLQTKSGRGILEQAETMLATLRQAIEQFRSVEPKEAQAAWSAGKPLALALADLDEALDRGRREIEKARDRIAAESTSTLVAALEENFRRQPWLRRRMAHGYHREICGLVRDFGSVLRELFDSLLEGYELIQNRLRREMREERIERVPCDGCPVDPERMTVIEVVHDPSRAPGTVLKELRSGYTWNGRLLRYAEVQAASAVRGASTRRAHAADAQSDGEIGDDNHGRDGDRGAASDITIEEDFDIHAGLNATGDRRVSD
jgi:molecular chaperone GrpE